MAGPIFWPMDEAPNVLRFYRDWIADYPDDLMTIVVQRKAPALPVVPPDLVGQRVVAIVCCHAGSIEEGEKVVRPLKDSDLLSSISVAQAVSHASGDV